MVSMKIIFLDIDGVLTRPRNPVSRTHFGFTFDDGSVSVLKDILKRSDAKIVVTSIWKLGKDLDSLKEIFEHYGLDTYIYDKIPDSKFYIEREIEIKDYLKSHDVDSFIILDNMDLGTLNDHLLKTQFITGLQEVSKYDLEKAVRILNKE